MGDFSSFDMTSAKFFRVNVGRDTKAKEPNVIALGLRGFNTVKIGMTRVELELVRDALEEFLGGDGSEVYKGLADGKATDRPSYGGKEPW